MAGLRGNESGSRRAEPWYHLVVVYSTAFSPRGKVYLNGVEQSIAIVGSHQSHIVSSGGNLYIGSQNAGLPYHGD